MDAMREALRRHRSKRIDSTGHGELADGYVPQDPKGDLAPSGEHESAHGGDMLNQQDFDHDESPEKMAMERKAIHAKEGAPGAMHKGMELHNPEHEPVKRDMEHVDSMGHEQSDDQFESLMTEGHEHDTLTKPKTLGARVRAALYNKKKGL